ncbi:MAG: tetratricopeptide repeat protein [Planctomycetia bacterium]|nr:tetratricopeptide repeat protein [Planctomycetia bacterium]MCC7315474.1 tetratricopeptide repeat protein [Planctomycetota bacterium]
MRPRNKKAGQHRHPRASSQARTAPKRDYSRWRALTLASVYVLMVIHVVHWKLAGRTLAPLELNEVMYTLELGIVTAGFVFMAVAMLATLIFGRFFCSWGCHILALEDLAGWLLGKLRIRPMPIRSRMLRWVPLSAMLYMFVWPQIARLLAGQPMPIMHVRSDAQGWASFVTDNFWRNLPGPGVALLTFFVCGFVMVYMLGSRGFCTYACPYGALFGIADRLAPGRIVARGDCSRCGKCTAACQSHVLVHKELVAYGRVIDPACLKDLDCIAACPEGRVGYGMAKPSILSLPVKGAVPRLAYDFSWPEEILIALVFLASLLIFRGLYGIVPFLLTLAVGGILAYFTILACRLTSRPFVRLNNFHLKQRGRLTKSGWAFATSALAMAGFTAHSALIRYHEFQADRLFASAQHDFARSGAFTNSAEVQDAIQHFEFARSWGILDRPEQATKLADLHAGLGRSLADSREFEDALRHLEAASALRPENAPDSYNLAVVLSAAGLSDRAIAEYRRTTRLAPTDPDAQNNLGLLLASHGDFAAAVHHLELAIRLRPDFALPHFNLGRIHLTRGDEQAAIRQFQAAVSMDPNLAPVVSELVQADRH